MTAAGEADTAPVTLGPRVEREHPLSRIQEQIWTSQRMHRSAPLANMAKLHHISGPVDPERLRRAFEQVVRESDALRSVIVDRVGQEPVIRVLSAPPDDTELLDLPAAELEGWIRERIARPVDVTRCAYDSVLFRHGDLDWSWWLDLHHLVTDAWASAEVYRATAARYEASENGAQPAPLPSFYAHVDELARRFEQGREARVARWSDLPVDATPVAPYGPRAAATTAVKRVAVEIDPAVDAALAGPYRTLSRELALIGLLSSALVTVLYRLDGRSRFTFGIPLHHRSGPVAPRVVGPVMELYPLSVEMDGEETFADLFNRVQRALLDTMRHAKPGESPDLPFDAVLNVVTAQFEDFAGLPTVTEWWRSGHVDPAHPIRLHTYDYGSGMRVEVDLNEGLSADGAHLALAGHLAAAVSAASTDPTASIGAVALANVDDRERLSHLNPPRTHPVPEEPVHEVVRRKLRARPEAVIAECAGRTMTAGDLDRRADALAAWLVERGTVPGARVGVRMERSLDVLAAIHGVLRCGAAFVMMDPADPVSRHAAIEADAELVTVLDEVPDLPPTHAPPVVQVTPDDLAYILYTSGSTGLPKGVPISHRGLADYLDFAVDAYTESGSPPVMPLHSALVFDLTITSLFLPQLTGGRTVVVPGEPLQALSTIAGDRRLNTLKATPGQLELLARMIDDPLALRTVIVGGEAFRRPVAEAFAASCATGVRIFNEYGPTEAVVGCMLHEWQPARDRGSDVPIGRACPGAEVHVLDRFRRPTPTGSWGELYVSRPGMATGYLNRPDLSAERFLSLPAVSDRPLYRTGDRVRVENEVLVYGGRMDDQLKVNGVRLEPGEIEAALTTYPAVTNAVVRTWTPAQRANRLRRCRRCGLGTDVPGVALDAAGICSVCGRFDDVAPRTTEWFRSPDDLDAERERARSRSKGNHDCLHLLSGGKDSTYALYQLVDRGWRVHALTLDNGFIAEGAKENIRRSVTDLGITHEFVTTEAMNEILRDSLDRYANVCNGCYKTIYTLAVARAHELGIPVIVTGLSRGQFFETRLAPHQFEEGRFDPAAIDHTVLQARRTYHHTRDAVTELLPEQQVFERDDLDVLSEVDFVDFYRYVDVSLAEIYDFLEARAPWVRPADTGRSTNCLVNVAGIFVHRSERGYHNYAEPYSWDVRLGHKTRAEALDELDDEIDHDEVERLLDTIGYQPKRPEVLTAWYRTTDGEAVDAALLRAHLRERIPERAMPTAFVHVADLPLAESAKVDVGALPAPARELGAAGDYTPPSTPTEAVVAAVWSAVLDTARVSIDDDFFDLGGASLAALESVAAVESRLGLGLPDAFVFEHRTVREFAAAVDALRGATSMRAAIPVLDGAGPAPLTEGEEAMLFEYRADPTDRRYNVTRLYTVDVSVDLERLHDAFRVVVGRHSALRTAFDAARTMLSVDAALSFEPFPTDDHRRDADVLRGVPFDLDRGPLVRVHAGECVEGGADILIGVHHITVDAGTFDLLWDEVDRAYHGEAMAALPTTVAAHGEWQRRSTGDGAEFWSARRAASAGADPARLPVVRVEESDGYLRAEATVSTSELAATGTTPFAVSLAAAAITLGAYSRTGHVDLGVTASRKDHPDITPAIGYFLNTLPLAIDVDPAATIHETVMDAGRLVATVLPHRAYPYARMVADARADGQAVPDISLMLAYEQLAPSSFGGAPADHEILASGVSIGDLTLFVQERGERILLGAEYRGATVGGEIARSVLDCFSRALTACCRQPHHVVEELWTTGVAPDLVGPPLDEAPTVVERILYHARVAPDRIAVRAVDGDVGYGALGERAAAIAAGIRAVEPAASRVGVAVHRTSELLPAILGVWLAGAAYVPLDPTVPPARRERVVGAAELDLVVADHDVSSWCPVRALALADVGPAADRELPAVAPEDPAYVIFTSGSTGVPAGVVVTHANLASSTTARPEVYGSAAPERFLLTSSIGFDSSMVGLFWPLATGGSILLAGDEDVHDLDRLAALAEAGGATHLLMVPTLYRALLERHSDRLGSLQVAIVAGESCPPALVGDHRRLLPAARLFNEYGPTEATVWASVHECGGGEDPVPIGGPIPGGRLRVADRHGRAMPPGAVGELWVAGPGVALGYMSGRDASAFFARDGVRWYRTGDLVRVDGEALLFLGRIDDQLNVGGVRVEPEELETEITALDGVTDAVVVAHRVGDRDTLVAHVVADEGRTSPAEVRRFLSARHGAAAPRLVTFVESLPRTIHGKLDRSAAAALPVPVVEPDLDARTDSFVAIWRRALGDSTLGPDDEFFAAGGDSIAAVEIVTAVGALVGREVPVGLLLRSGSPQAMARELGVALDLRRRPEASLVTMRQGAAEGPLVIQTPAWDDVSAYRDLADAFPGDVSVLAVAVVDPFGVADSPLHRVGPLAEAVLPELTERAAGRRVAVVGWSIGGVVAQELGRRLAEEGVEVQFAALVDTFFPGQHERLWANRWMKYRSLLRPGSFREAAGEFTELGGRRLRRYGDRLGRAGLALRGRPLPPVPPERVSAGRVPVAALGHDPVPCGVPLVLYAATETARDRTEIPWREVEPDLDVVPVEGRHRGVKSVMDNPRVAAIADDMTVRLRGAF